MKTLFLLLSLIGLQAQALPGEVRSVFCDFEDEYQSVYLDLYLVTDSTGLMFSLKEVGVSVATDGPVTEVYPDNLWKLSVSINPPIAISYIVTRTEGELNFVLPAYLSPAGKSGILLKTTDGVINTFLLPVSGVINGENVDEKFSCYDNTYEPPTARNASYR